MNKTILTGLSADYACNSNIRRLTTTLQANGYSTGLAGRSSSTNN
ncbi:hypothetical protein [Bacteroides sp. BFG-606]|nr:hypothetical protein [Bacteroides sp. BFG-606]MCS2334109.1 hypothetical protein [Bacteroides sp. BFG-606]